MRLLEQEPPLLFQGFFGAGLMGKKKTTKPKKKKPQKPPVKMAGGKKGY